MGCDHGDLTGEALKLSEWEPGRVADQFGHAHRQQAKAVAVSRERYLNAALVFTPAAPLDQPGFLHAAQQGRERSRIELEPVTQLAHRDRIILPQHHEHEVLRVGDPEGASNSRYRAVIAREALEREANLVVELRHVVCDQSVCAQSHAIMLAH